MKLFLRAVAAIISLTCSINLSAQDSWILSARDGLSDMNNTTVYGMNVFNGKIYAALGSDSGYVYSSSTGNINSWTRVFSNPSVNSVTSIISTSAGGGNMFISTSSNWDSSRVFRTTDGITWNPYFVTPSPVSGVVTFQGAGAADSVYVIEGYNYMGGRILKSHVNSNDPNNLTGAWDTVLDFEQSSPYTNIICTGKHNNKLYIGTSLAGIWSSADGTNWTENLNVGAGFGNPNNISISAIGSFGGAIYIGTENSVDGAQIWKSIDEVNWTLVEQLPYTYSAISSLTNADNKLWYTAKANQSGIVAKSSDGVTFTVSNNTSFDSPGNTGNRASLTQFGNNLYWGGEHYYFIGGKSFNMPGAQIYRLCIVTPPTVNAGPDQTVCPNTPITFSANPGASQYLWSNGQTAQSFTTPWTGYMILEYIGTNGCSAIDSVLISNLPAPAITITNPSTMMPGIPYTVCRGTSVNITGSAISNVYSPLTPISKTTNDSISDLLLPVFDTINVSGLSSLTASGAILSVTIDSLYHTYTGDLEMRLYAPDGSNIALSQTGEASSYTGYFGTQFIMNAPEWIGSASPPYTGSYVPYDNFNILTGQPNGNWVLSVQDWAGSDDGKLKGWSIRFKLDDSVMTYSWTPATGLSSVNTLNTIATPTVSTTYSLTVSNSIGCQTSLPFDFAVPSLSFPQSADTACFGSTITLFAEGGTSATTWTPAATLDVSVGVSVNATPSVSTVYYAHDTISGCPVVDSIYIHANSQLFLNSPLSQTICTNDTVTFTASANGGSAPYIYTWDTGGNYLYGETIQDVPAGGTSYTISATDAAGCFVGGGSTSVGVIPSTDVYGHVGFSGGSVTASNVVLYKYYPFLTQFDTAAITITDGAGNFHFPSVDHSNYLIEVYPDPTYSTLVPTYYGNNYLWDSASVVSHDCSDNDTLAITAVEFVPISGPGTLQGTILQGPGYAGGFMSAQLPGDRVPGEPIPGIDVKLGRNPGGQLIVNTTTDANGDYSFSNLPLNGLNEWYTVYVDIPGLGRDSSYSVVLDAVNNAYVDLDYFVDSTVVYIVDNLATGISSNTPVKDQEALFNVYPNPTKGNATITYSLSTEGSVSLAIYNVLGIKVADLVSEKQTKGVYQVQLGEKEQKLSNGIYFVKLITENNTVTHQLVISK